MCFAPWLERRFGSVKESQHPFGEYTLLIKVLILITLSQYIRNRSYPMTPTLPPFSIVSQSIRLAPNLACCCSGSTSTPLGGEMPSDTALIPDTDCRTTSVPRGHIAQLTASQSTFIRIWPALLQSWSLLDHGNSSSVRKRNLPRAWVRIARIEAQP